MHDTKGIFLSYRSQGLPEALYLVENGHVEAGKSHTGCGPPPSLPFQVNYKALQNKNKIKKLFVLVFLLRSSFPIESKIILPFSNPIELKII